MRIDVLTVLPRLFDCFLSEGVIGRAVKNRRVMVDIVDIRDFTFDRHKTVDDEPYGGGPGMVLKVEPIMRAYKSIVKGDRKPFVILTEPWGKPFNQQMAIELSKKEWLTIICGRYEGVDERVKSIVDEEVSIGNFILTGGELASQVIMDATIRLLPGVLGNKQSLEADSFMDRGLMGYPNYTRPVEFNGMKVPDVLVSGNHRKIELWRKEQAISKTLKRNPDVIEKLTRENKLTKDEVKILKKLRQNLP